MPKKITIDAPDAATILAARQLDAEGGPVYVGDVISMSTRRALDTVLRYIAMAHNAPAAAPEICELPHETIEEENKCEAANLPATGTLPAWLAQRFDPQGAPWDGMSEDDRTYWEHQARAVMRAVGRGGFRSTRPEPTPCGPAPDSCEPGAEPCGRHEREESHADGEHELCGVECGATDPALLKQALTRAVFALKTPARGVSPHYLGGWDDALEAAIGAIAQVFDTLD